MSSAPSSPSAVTSPEPWRRLFSLQKKEVEDRRGLIAQLAAWSEKNGGAQAAIYGRSDDLLELVASVGETSFPERASGPRSDFSDGEPTPVDDLGPLPTGEGWNQLELPDLLVVHSDGVEGPAHEGLLLLSAAARISQLKRQIQEQSFQAMFRGVELEALYEVGLAIASTLDLERLGEEVLMRALVLLDARRGALYLLDDGIYRRTSFLGGSAKTYFDASEVDVQALVCDGDSPLVELLPGARHLMAVPVELDGKALGILLVADKESRVGVGPFPSKDSRTLSLFANQAAIALENAKLHKLALEKERLERDMELAAEIQQELLPNAMPQIPKTEVLGWNLPARQVGGDYFGFQDLADGRHTLVVADVTGKGMPAALLVSTLHSALFLLLESMEMGPALVERLNHHTHEASSANKFITMILAVFDPSDSRLGYVNAGHNPGVLLRRDGSVEQLKSGGLPLGLMSGVPYTAGELQLESGDFLCLYSDGITECESRDDEEYGLDRLIDLLAEAKDQPLEVIRERIDKVMLDWSDGLPQGDDQTVVLLRHL